MSALYDFSARSIDGQEKSLARYRGNVVLVVNVASECGFTPQYAALKKLHERYRGKGFDLLAFPCNDFSEQEPGTDEEIRSFCTSRFGIDFDMFSKIRIVGSDPHPLYRWLQDSAVLPKPSSRLKSGLFNWVKSVMFFLKGKKIPGPGEVQWNFHKYLIDRQGRVSAAFYSETDPLDPALTGRIEKELEG
ncbi:MAG: glutathione peroxidase [Nitrospinae bacterium CG11_big_fil_rev_8_21_14_0_20_56_8]|nr:MAG: glutathione peroxidase [Nitrospinae bacterium CG11_big_fil_rev_8_21_14_0_20_56_8]